MGVDFDRSAVRHRLAVVGDWDFAVFVRADDKTIEHWWNAGGDRHIMFGPELLGGDFDTDPVVAFEVHGDVRRLHLIGRSGIKLVDWWWDDPDYGTWLGAPQERLLPGWCATEPEVVVSSGRLNVFALGVDGVIRHWFLGNYGWFTPTTLPEASAFSTPAAVSRAPGIFDVFAANRYTKMLCHWWNADGDWQFERRAAGDPRGFLQGSVAAASYNRERLDVFALEAVGGPEVVRGPVHWGWDGDHGWFDYDVTLSTEHTPGAGEVRCRDMALVEHGGAGLSLVGSLEDDSLVIWDLQAPHGWDPRMMELGSSRHPVTAWSPGFGEVSVLNRNDDGSFTHYWLRNEPGHGMGEAVYWEWDHATLTLAEPEPRPRDLAPAAADAQLLLLRPADLVVMGLRWSDAEVTASSAGPAELVAGERAELSVFLPPQHVAEEVLTSEEAGEASGEVPTRDAALAGPSRLVAGLPARSSLSAAGLLDALRHGQVIPSAGTADAKTALELPYGLAISPYTPDGTSIACTHPAEPVDSSAGAVGLWQTSIGAAGATPGGPAGLSLRAIDASATDPFPLALTGGSRTRIVLEEPTAQIRRLSLSALGGSLEAAGHWQGFAWEHTATLGRDRRVRTVTKGVLYPFGHQAEYVEVTERIFEGSDAGATAYLRKSTSLVITEPSLAGDRVFGAAFPFLEVAFDQTRYDVQAAVWERQDFPTPELERLEDARQEAIARLGELRQQLRPDSGEGPPYVEEIAERPEFAAVLADAAHPEWGTKADVAEAYLRMHAKIERIKAQIDALPHGGAVSVDLFFVPRVPIVGSTAPVRFPVRLRGVLGDVHVSLPLVFVADIKKRHSLLHPAFDSLDDPEVAARVADAYRAEGDGDVAVEGARIDLVCADERREADVCEVTRLHIAGELRDGGFHPRLGAAPDPTEEDEPTAHRWGFDVVLPAVRTLLGRDQGPLRLAYSRDLLESDADVDVPFRVPEGAARLATDFANNSARSGGLAAPDFEATGISRTYGPVNAAGVLDRVDGHLDPAKLLSESATLLGFRLIDLVDTNSLDKPPAITSTTHDGAPQVTLSWPGIKLHTESGAFVTRPDSTLDLNVTIDSGEPTGDHRPACVVRNVALALPDQDPATKLIEVTFDTIEFDQVPGRAPTLTITGIDAKFFGILELLKELQEAVDLGATGPHVEPTPTGITASYTLPVPDVTAGYFQLAGVVFHAGLYVPFDARPVSLSLAFASREKPFNLSVLAFGGGGYVDALIDNTGLRRLELALEFGASLAVDFVVASGEVHAMGGVFIVNEDGAWRLGGYIRFGGSVEILGLISLAIELTVALTYDVDGKRMWGRATLVLELDLTLWSTSLEIDSGEWELIGGDDAHQPAPRLPAPPAPMPTSGLDDWIRYRSAFTGAR